MPRPQPPAGAVQVDVAQVEAVAENFRKIVVWFGLGQLLAPLIMWTVAPAIESAGYQPLAGVFGVICQLSILAATITMVVYVYHLTEAMGSSAPWAWVVAMFLPCVNVIALLALSSNAQTWCRVNGIPVGLLGPSKAAIEQLRREAFGRAAQTAMALPVQPDPAPAERNALTTSTSDYIRDCRALKMSDAEIVQQLIAAGWAADQSAQAVASTPSQPAP
jgi:hypothetical protein